MSLHVNYLAAKLKRYFPRIIWDRIVSPFCAIPLGLYNFAIATGWLRSVLGRRAVNAKGEAIPWLSYPCVEFLENLPMGKDNNILECGGGQSTLYFLRRGCNVWCIEPDHEWRKEIDRKCTEEQRKRLHFISTLGEIVKGMEFYIILVDLNPMSHYMDHFTEDKIKFRFLIVDNTEIIDQSVEWKNSLIDTLSGWCQRKDYIGFAAGNACQQSTSVFISRYHYLNYLPVISLTQYKFKD